MATSASVVATEDPIRVMFRALNRGIWASTDSMIELTSAVLDS